MFSISFIICRIHDDTEYMMIWYSSKNMKAMIIFLISRKALRKTKTSYTILEFHLFIPNLWFSLKDSTFRFYTWKAYFKSEWYLRYIGNYLFAKIYFIFVCLFVWMPGKSDQIVPQYPWEPAWVGHVAKQTEYANVLPSLWCSQKRCLRSHEQAA